MEHVRIVLTPTHIAVCAHQDSLETTAKMVVHIDQSMLHISFRSSFSFNFTEALTQIPPSILSPPQTLSGILFSAHNLTCRVAGFPPPDIAWFKDNVRVEERLQNKPYLEFSNLTIVDRGSYHCEATNNVNGLSKVTSDPVIVDIAG